MLCSALVFENYIYNMTQIYKPDKLMFLFGGDFSFSNMTETLALFEILSYLKSSITSFKVSIATPAEYFDAIFNENYDFPVFGGDFFPNIISGTPYMKAWTGYFTTRPYLKYRIASTQKMVRSAELLQSLINGNSFVGYQDSIGTHHDAYTGTCRHEVFVDYVRRLDDDHFKSLAAISDSFFTLAKRTKSSTAIMIPYKVMIVFNPINKKVQRLVSFVSKSEYLAIHDSNGLSISSQTVPFNQSFEIYCKVSLEPFGFKVLFINEFSSDCDFCNFPSSVSFKNKIHNGKIGLEFENGLISKIFNKDIQHDLKSSIMGYNSSNGGPYIFYPEVISI